MKYRKVISKVALLLFSFTIFSCSNSFINKGMFVNDFVKLDTIPSKDDCDNKENNIDIEKQIEDAFGTKLWKATFDLAKEPVYLRITDLEKNLIEFNTSKNLITYFYKAIDDNWIILKNKTNTVTIKFDKSLENEIYTIVPSSLLYEEMEDTGCLLIFKESNDDVVLENNSNPSEESEVTPNPEPLPEPKPEVEDKIPTEKGFVIVSNDELSKFIKDGNFSKVYYDFNKSSDYQKEFYKEGEISFIDNTISLTGANLNINLSFSIDKVEKKVSQTEDVFIATINITQSDNANLKQGIYFIIGEKRDGKSILSMTTDGLELKFTTVDEFATTKPTIINYSTDVIDKLISIRSESETYMSMWIEEGKIVPTDHGKITFLDNKIYLGTKYVADYKVIESGFGKNEITRNYVNPYAKIEISNSKIPKYLGNTIYDVWINSDLRYFRMQAKDYTVLHIAPEGTINGMQSEPREVFIKELDKQLNIEHSLSEYEKERKEPYKLIKDEQDVNLYKIVSSSGKLYASFNVLETGLMVGVTHCAGIQIVDCASDAILDKGGYYCLFIMASDAVAEGFSISNYDEDYRFSLLTDRYNK